MMNTNGVSLAGNKLIILMPPRGPMAKTDALNLAAWLVVMAGTIHDEPSGTPGQGDGETQAEFDRLYAEALES